jgi:hypothetical protein
MYLQQYLNKSLFNINEQKYFFKRTDPDYVQGKTQYIGNFPLPLKIPKIDCINSMPADFVLPKDDAVIILAIAPLEYHLA